MTIWSVFSHSDRHALLACDFTLDELAGLRDAVAGQAARAGLVGARGDDFVLAVHEGAVNAVDHGGGSGRVRLWRTRTLLCCQISDDGPGLPAYRRWARLRGPIGRRPEPRETGGRGLWLIGRLADDSSLSSGPHGTIVQLAFLLPH
ncbi:ATP-binding protein [Nonomuraea sp. NPDC050404]|uniref:ATP-binding protein n=1 Tax=Nonomuraea sp. NPDC050404 TaxID=3155783 RepID=UPI00340EA25D